MASGTTPPEFLSGRLVPPHSGCWAALRIGYSGEQSAHRQLMAADGGPRQATVQGWWLASGKNPDELGIAEERKGAVPLAIVIVIECPAVRLRDREGVR